MADRSGTEAAAAGRGVLSGVTIVEMGGIGPAPFAGMMLADHGAEVIRIDRAGGGHYYSSKDVLNRNRRSIALDLKSPKGIEIVRKLCSKAEAVIEGYRPGVMERMGLGPSVLLEDNPRLVFARMTGWGQTGPYASMAGHDINYIAITGALNACGVKGGAPVVPLNLVGDFGGGGMLLAFGVVSAILHARATGHGQEIDCAMVDGASALMAMIWRFRAEGRWTDERGSNLLDGGAPFYDCFETADGKYISIGAIEPQFFDELRKGLGLSDDCAFDERQKPENWDRMKARIADIIRTKTRDEWCGIFEGTDACFAPVLSMAEAPHHPHIAQRQSLIEVEAVLQPAPAPRYSATPAPTPRAAPLPGGDTAMLLAWLGYAQSDIRALLDARIVTQAE